MAIAWVSVEGPRTALDTQMSAQGFVQFVRAQVGTEERLYILPHGLYWMAEPTDERELLRRCQTAAKDAGIVSARIVVVAGGAAWDGLAAVVDG